MGYHDEGFPFEKPQLHEPGTPSAEQTRKKAAVVGFVGGAILTAGGLLASLSGSEAEPEPYRIKGPGISVNVEDGSDLPYLLAGSGGLVIMGLASEQLLKSRKED